MSPLVPSGELLAAWFLTHTMSVSYSTWTDLEGLIGSNMLKLSAIIPINACFSTDAGSLQNFRVSESESTRSTSLNPTTSGFILPIFFHGLPPSSHLPAPHRRGRAAAHERGRAVHRDPDAAVEGSAAGGGQALSSAEWGNDAAEGGQGGLPGSRRRG